MKEHADNQKKAHSQAIASIQKKENSLSENPHFEDNRPEMVLMRKLQDTGSTSADSNSGKGKEAGLPEPLKSGVETLSGHAMDDVKVHYDSDQPNQLQAHAYAQGTDIHLAPGQEKHLPHEAWHVVQQKQGRVQPTKQLKGKVNINDNQGLENEADVMGAKASQHSFTSGNSSVQTKAITGSTAQLVADKPATDEKLKDKSTLKDLDKQKEKIVSTDELKGYGYEKENDAGLGQKITAEGDVSWRSKIGGWFGDEGTWSKFLVAVDLYNNAKTIEEKQQQLYILKKEAHKWLTDKEDKLKEGNTSDKENDQKKYSTIQKFIQLTTSNHPEIIKGYQELKGRISEFKKDPIGKRKEFKALVLKYNDLDKEVKKYKETYPPAVNLHFGTEWAGIQAEKQEASQDIIVTKGPLNLGGYLEVLDPELIFNLSRAELAAQGRLKIGIADITVDEKTKVKIVMNEEGEYKSLHIVDGSLKVKIGDLEVELKSLNYEAGVLTAESATGKINIMDKEVGLSVSMPKVSKEGFDYKEISGSLDSMDLGIVKLDKPQITYIKGENAFKGEFDYDLSLDKPFDSTAKSTGKFSFEWSPKDGEKRNFTLDKAEFAFSLLGQSLKTKDTSYNHKKKMFDAKEAELEVDLVFFKKKKFKGTNVSVGKSYFDFTELSLGSDFSEMPFGPLSITPTKYALFKDDSKGYGIKADGKGTLNLPKGLDVSSSASFEGFVGIYFKEPTKPTVELTKGNAALEFTNPLAKLSDFLGNDWTNTRFDLGATIPVFPGISAIFGLYLQLLATLPDKIKGSAELNEKKLNLAIGTEQKLGVEGGVYGGIQAGSQLLLALAALLRAAGKFDMDAEVGYKKTMDLNPESKEKPDGEVKNETDGFYYSLSGGLKVGAYLDLVATALYFFNKTFTLTLKEWNLGEFNFTNKKQEEKQLETGKTTLFKDEDLKGKLDNDSVKAHPEIKNLTAEQLLDQKENQRFSGKQKEEILDVIKNTETGRANALEVAKSEREATKAESGSLGALEVFDNVALANMQFFDQYVDKFVTWDLVHKYLTELVRANSESDVDKKKLIIKPNLLLLKDVLTIPGIFATHFVELNGKFHEKYSLYKGTSSTTYKEYLATKAAILEEVHRFKQEKLHSQFWGDENKIDANLRSWSFYGSTPLAEMVAAYTALQQNIEKVKDVISVNDKAKRYQMAENALLEMNKEYQSRLKINRSSQSKAK